MRLDNGRGADQARRSIAAGKRVGLPVPLKALMGATGTVKAVSCQPGQPGQAGPSWAVDLADLAGPNQADPMRSLPP